MSGYYRQKLSAKRLKQAYDMAPPRIRQYLEAEVHHVLGKIRPGDVVLELGCGYGRILPSLAQKAGRVIGIDTSWDSLLLGREMLADIANCVLLQMDAIQLAFGDKTLDVVVCIQNGISAFHVDQHRLIEESLRVVKPGGSALFSSYSEKFWVDRLAWFQLQSDAGLLGEIDLEKSRDGQIVCKDGFTATTVFPEQFLALIEGPDVDARIDEVDESSLFCEITAPKSWMGTSD
jgi:2-polyprenyl-6-hydroxyphenyl methylase/3-demethylubiquinone-9 3-methyltransferase